MIVENIGEEHDYGGRKPIFKAPLTVTMVYSLRKDHQLTIVIKNFTKDCRLLISLKYQINRAHPELNVAIVAMSVQNKLQETIDSIGAFFVY